jgi:hypothetical protein
VAIAFGGFGSRRSIAFPLTAILQTKRDLDLFGGHHHSIALQNKLASILGPLGAS